MILFLVVNGYLNFMIVGRVVDWLFYLRWVMLVLWLFFWIKLLGDVFKIFVNLNIWSIVIINNIGVIVKKV